MGSTIAHSASVKSLGNEGHCGPRQRGVRASTSGALQRIKRPTMNHIRLTRLKNFPDRLLRSSKTGRHSGFELSSDGKPASNFQESALRIVLDVRAQFGDRAEAHSALRKL